MKAAHDIAAVVLAGGEGRRMGGRKPMRRLGGSTLLGCALDLARGYGEAVAVAVRAAEQVSAPVGAPLLLDDARLEGPIAGLASALAFGEARGADKVLTLPCDAPLLPPDLASRLSAALRRIGQVAVATSGGRLHPTCALWKISARRELADYLRGGGRSLKGFARVCGMVEVEWAIPDHDPFTNVNTPEDLDRIRPMAARGLAALVGA
jgi:molybdopterin-guanine dinucleotide biosynthesis protein A